MMKILERGGKYYHISFFGNLNDDHIIMLNHSVVDLEVDWKLKM